MTSFLSAHYNTITIYCFHLQIFSKRSFNTIKYQIKIVVIQSDLNLQSIFLLMIIHSQLSNIWPLFFFINTTPFGEGVVLLKSLSTTKASSLFRMPYQAVPLQFADSRCKLLCIVDQLVKKLRVLWFH